MPNNIDQFLRYVAATIISCVIAFPCAAQTRTQAPPQPQWLQDLTTNPELQAEIGKLSVRLQKELQFPDPRTESHLLPLLPSRTMFYAAFPNYGDVIHQTSGIFQDELKQSAALRNWWEHNGMEKIGPVLQASAEQIYQLSQYLGDEIVITGGSEDHEPKIIILAKARKPGFKEALEQVLSASHNKANPGIVILTPKDLAAAQSGPEKKFLILVRPDYIAAALDVATLRALNVSLDKQAGDFASSAFGQRVTQAYEGGATTVGAIDVHSILGELPIAKNGAEPTFQRTGFADARYWVWRRKKVGGQTISQAELTFLGPRHGIASWLASPAPMGSLDFVSPKAILVGSVRLANPALMFDDVNEIASASNAKPFAGIEPFEQMFHVSLRDDVLKRLSGEITLELDDIAPPTATWKVVFGTNDASGLQQTLDSLLAALHFAPQVFQEEGTTFRTLRIPTQKTTVEVTYAFQNNYWIIASSRQAAVDAVRLQRSGESLGKSPALQTSLPPGHPSGFSALMFEDPVAVGALQMERFAPQMAGSLAQLKGTQKSAVVALYADESSIREESTSAGFDAAGVMVVAALAIPNLLRSRIAANEASAVGSVRSVNTAEAAYSTEYPTKGFAAALATLGSDPTGKPGETAEHAGIIDPTLAGADCRNDAWCTKSGFRFRLTAECPGKLCKEFLVVATPVGTNTGTRSFCSTSDSIVRSKPAPTDPLPMNAKECRSWPPLN